MPFGAVAGAVAGGLATGVGGALVSGLMSPGTSGGNAGGSYYTPTGLQTADQQWQALQTGNINAYNQYALAPYGYTSLSEGINANNIYGPNAQAGAVSAGNVYGNNSQYNANMAGTLAGQAVGNYGAQNYLQGVGRDQYGALTGAGQQVWNTALDPQSALYNRTVQQLQDQTGATNSMYGLGSSAAGAGVANQALSNFNIDWQNAQLQRQTQGLQALAGAYGQAGGTLGSLYGSGAQYGQLAGQQLGQASGLQNQAASDALNAGMTPYNTAQQIAGVSGQLGNTFGQYLNSNVYGPAQSFQGQAIPYMNYGQGAQSIPYQANTQGAGAAGSLFANSGIGGLVNQGVQSLFGGSGGQSGHFGALQSLGYGGFGQSADTGYSGGGNTYGFTLG